MLEKNIKNLIKILEESKVDELEISTFWGKQKIKVRKNTNSNIEKNIKSVQNTTNLTKRSAQKQTDVPKFGPKPEPIEVTPLIQDIISTEDHHTASIKAPLVGTYYNAPKPGATPFLSEGDTIKEGQIICIIEAMKIFNEIESEIAGKVVNILIKDGTPVEYDQALIVIIPE